MSWLFGAAGTTNFTAIQRSACRVARRMPAKGLLEIAFALMLAGLCFRITAVPFHFYAPDVFQGTTAANAALLSYIPKIVGFVALLRLIPLTGAIGELSTLWVPDHPAKLLLAVLAVAHDVRRQPDGAAAEAPVSADGVFQHRARRATC